MGSMQEINGPFRDEQRDKAIPGPAPMWSLISLGIGLDEAAMDVMTVWASNTAASRSSQSPFRIFAFALVDPAIVAVCKSLCGAKEI